MLTPDLIFKPTIVFVTDWDKSGERLLQIGIAFLQRSLLDAVLQIATAFIKESVKY